MIFAAVAALALVSYEEPGWKTTSTSGEVFWINNSETRPGFGGAIVVWLHSYVPPATIDPHPVKARYRTAIWRKSFDCKGNVSDMAVTTYNGNGDGVYSWDGYSTTAIRPGTVTASIEKFVCAQ